MRRTKVLYIAGSNRCGSTLLARVLGDLPGFFTIGEGIVHFFYGSSEEHVPCGCGLDVHECSFWNGIPFPLEPDRLAAQWLRLRRTALLPSYLRRHPEQARRWVNSVSDFYHAIAERSGAKVIVDSSKSPCHARLLSLVPDVDLYLVHLVRDPRGVAASSRRRKEWLPGASPFRATARWLGMTLGSAYLQSRMARSRTLRYEDFVKEPRQVILKIVGDLGVTELTTPFVNDSVIDLRPQHMLGSNPDKLRSGPTRIAKRSVELPWLHRALVSVLTAPALLRYGYWPGGESDLSQPVSSQPTTSLPEIVHDAKEEF